MKFLTHSLLLAVALSAGSAFAQYCTVADPSSTPLNVRSNVLGKIKDKLADGTEVEVIRTAYDKHGKPWAKIGYWRNGDYREGWVRYDYLAC